MTVLQSSALILEEFLRLPETKLPREYLNGEIMQKPTPKARHSRLQSKLLSAINGVAENSRIAYAFAELQRERQPQFCHRTDPLPVLEGIKLALTAQEVFHWLKMTRESVRC